MKRILFALAFAACLASGRRADAANPVVVMKTSQGTIKIELFEDKAPITVKNFLKYVEDKHYDDTVFHRVMSDFMIQGGGFEKGFNKVSTRAQADAKEKRTRGGIKNESTNGLSNKKYTIAMARTPEPDSASAQFYINVKDNDSLDRANADDGVGYCVFGKVIDGIAVVDKIKGVKTKVVVPRVHTHVPADEVVIESIRVEKK